MQPSQLAWSFYISLHYTDLQTHVEICLSASVATQPTYQQSVVVPRDLRRDIARLRSGWDCTCKTTMESFLGYRGLPWCTSTWNVWNVQQLQSFKFSHMHGSLWQANGTRLAVERYLPRLAVNKCGAAFPKKSHRREKSGHPLLSQAATALPLAASATGRILAFLLAHNYQFMWQNSKLT